MRRDGYLRFDATGPPEHHGDGPDRIVFIDIAVGLGDRSDRLADQLRRAPRGFFGAVDAVVVRWPPQFGPPSEGALRASLEQLRLLADRELPLAAATFRLQEPPQLAWFTFERGDFEDDEILALCRSIELDALLEWGRAIWRPDGYHYQLPSGEHSADFIKAGDAVSTLRDAEVLASWLLRFATPGLSLLVDTRGLIPVVAALASQLAAVRASLGPVVILGEYPETVLEYAAAVDRTGGAGVLALLSVTSSGRSQRELAAALAGRATSGWRLETLVTRSGPGAPLLDSGEVGAAWLAVETAGAYPSVKECELCLGRDRRPFVQIDPHSFSAMALPDPPLVAMPDVHAPGIGRLLEMYDRCDGIGLECAPPRRTELRRGKDPSAIRFYPHRLLTAEGFLEAVEGRLEEVFARDPGNPLDGWATPNAFDDADAIIVLGEDAEAVGFDAVIDVLRQRWHCPDAPVVVFDGGNTPPGRRDADQRKALFRAHRMVIVTVGAVTGGTLQELLWRVHAAKAGAEETYEVSGLALHARPSTFREWETLRNAYVGRLAALWLTYLPWRSVLNEEMRLVERVGGEGERHFAEQRVAICKPLTSEWERRKENFQNYGGVNPHALFWGIPPECADDALPRLLPTSRFGHEVGAIAAMVGMGVAMQRARLNNRSKGAPPWLHFDMAAVGPSYFDTLLFVSTLRWLEPYEGHWEAEGRSIDAVLNEVWERVAFSEDDRRILLPELLLAAAQAKLPRAAHRWLLQKAEEVSARWAQNQLAPVRFGLELLRAAHSV